MTLTVRTTVAAVLSCLSQLTLTSDQSQSLLFGLSCPFVPSCLFMLHYLWLPDCQSVLQPASAEPLVCAAPSVCCVLPVATIQPVCITLPVNATPPVCAARPTSIKPLMPVYRSKTVRLSSTLTELENQFNKIKFMGNSLQ